jgi:tRNA dimethylallyltransferase
MAGERKIVSIIGPTASGKSRLAMEVARQTGAQLLSVDSMQIYREMNIGTAKPSDEERREVDHHLLDIINPDETFAVARFVELADTVIAERRPLIAVGGTPLYFKALFQGLFEGPSANTELRQRLAEMGNERLYERLASLDPAAAQRINRNDTRRMVRALEVHELTGKPISNLQQQWSGAARHEAVWIGIHWEKSALNQRINARAKEMIAAGWLDETRALLEKFTALSRTAAEATGYHELIEHLQGRLTLDEAIEAIKIATRQLARRQMKWFRRFPNTTWLSGEAPLQQSIQTVLRLWENA